MGVTEKNYNQNGELTSVDIIIYEGTFTDFINAENPQSNRYRASVKSNDDIIGAVATHESFHATDEQNIKDGYENFKNRNNEKYEKMM